MKTPENMTDKNPLIALRGQVQHMTRRSPQTSSVDMSPGAHSDISSHSWPDMAKNGTPPPPRPASSDW